MPDDHPEDREPAAGQAGDEADDELVLHHIQGLKDPRRFEASAELLHGRYHARVHRFLRARRASPEDAEDLTQEAFLRVFRSNAKFEKTREFEKYLFQTAVNLLRNLVRDRTAVKRKAPEDSLDEWLERHADGVPPPADGRDRNGLGSVLEEERRREVAKALRTLPPAMGRCLVLLIFHEMQYREIAEFLGIEIGTVKAHLHQGRRRLGSLLAPYFGKGGPRSPGEAGA
jgi:RNA polymerase sigma-70 factor (ECF subfamily)